MAEISSSLIGVWNSEFQLLILSSLCVLNEYESNWRLIESSHSNANISFVCFHFLWQLARRWHLSQKSHALSRVKYASIRSRKCSKPGGSSAAAARFGIYLSGVVINKLLTVRPLSLPSNANKPIWTRLVAGNTRTRGISPQHSLYEY